jgi:CRISPR/Cas system-associated protein Cas7 (RAMP superfamily)
MYDHIHDVNKAHAQHTQYLAAKQYGKDVRRQMHAAIQRMAENKRKQVHAQKRRVFHNRIASQQPAVLLQGPGDAVRGVAQRELQAITHNLAR